MKPSELSRYLLKLLKSKAGRKAVMIWSPPGCGKSRIVSQTVAELRLGLLDIRAVHLEPADIIGIPYPLLLSYGGGKVYKPNENSPLIFETRDGLKL